MTIYTPPTDDMLFVLRHVVSRTATDEAVAELLEPVLDEAGTLAAGVLAPLNEVGDKQGLRFDGGQVHTPDGWQKAYKAYVDGGWGGAPFAQDVGGLNLSHKVNFALQEMWQSANLSLGLALMLNQAAADEILRHGTPEQKQTYVPNLVSGKWAGTMDLTEAQAGSDLGAIETYAKELPDGTYRLSGQKIFITYGEHDLAENIIHLVLARHEGAPAGMRGLSLFIVPKILPDGTQNEVVCTGIEHKLGIHAAPTCSMSFGGKDGALGYLMGRKGHGMSHMLDMMTRARLSVGLQGVAISERATQLACQYANERMQGGKLIKDYPDVRRMLLTMQSCTQAGRIMCANAAHALDSGDHALAALMTPVIKAWCTDRAVEVTSLGIQVLGGAGYIEDAGMAQYYRDARILPIYEGTNGIQATDFAMRKVLKDRAQTISRWIEGQKPLLAELDASHGFDMSMIGEAMGWGFDALRGATGCVIAAAAMDEKPNIYATSYAYITLAGHVMAGAALSKAALAAREILRAGSMEMFSPDFLHERILLARFFADHILPHTSGYARTVRNGSISVTSKTLQIDK